MFHRLYFKQLPKTKFLLIQEAGNLRKQADGMPRGIRCDELLRKAGQIDVASQINKWVSSSGLRTPT
jgi:hypothetical protein